MSNPINIELIFETTCPNVQQARDVIVQACQQLGIAAKWLEWNTADTNTPAALRRYGSPSILVAGQDVSASSGNECSCCRIYPENKTFKGCPALEDVVRALRATQC